MMVTYSRDGKLQCHHPNLPSILQSLQIRWTNLPVVQVSLLLTNQSEFISESNVFNRLGILEIPKPARLTVIQAGKFWLAILTQPGSRAG